MEDVILGEEKIAKIDEKCIRKFNLRLTNFSFLEKNIYKKKNIYKSIVRTIKKATNSKINKRRDFSRS